MTDPSVITGFLLIGITIALVGLLIVAIARGAARGLPRSPIVEYVPPAEGSIFEHGLALRADRRVLTAALIDLSVRGRVRVLTAGGAGGGRGPLAVEVIRGAQLTGEEREFLDAFRPEHMRPRQRRRYLRALSEIGVEVGAGTGADTGAAAGAASRADAAREPLPEVLFLRGRGVFRGARRRRLTTFLDRTRERMTAHGLTRKRANSVHLVLLSLLFLATLALGLVLVLGALVNGEWIGALAVLVDVALVFWVLTLAPPPLLRFTEHGQRMRQHLSGLRDYVRLAEQDRLRALQSPEGALRTPAGSLTPGGIALGLAPQPTAGDPVAQSELDRFVLVERLLPYAILFRQERAWQREFERLGGDVEITHSMRTLGHTLEGVMTVLDALVIVMQLFRAVGAVLSLFGRH